MCSGYDGFHRTFSRISSSLSSAKFSSIQPGAAGLDETASWIRVLSCTTNISSVCHDADGFWATPSLRSQAFGRRANSEKRLRPARRVGCCLGAHIGVVIGDETPNRRFAAARVGRGSASLIRVVVAAGQHLMQQHRRVGCLSDVDRISPACIATNPAGMLTLRPGPARPPRRPPIFVGQLVQLRSADHSRRAHRINSRPERLRLQSSPSGVSAHPACCGGHESGFQFGRFDRHRCGDVAQPEHRSGSGQPAAGAYSCNSLRRYSNCPTIWSCWSARISAVRPRRQPSRCLLAGSGYTS